MKKEEDRISENKLLAEKLAYGGMSSLTDTQLLAIIIGRGEANDGNISRAKQLIATHHTIENVIFNSKISTSTNVRNLASCVGELSRRLKSDDNTEEFIENNFDAERVVRPLFRGAAGEEFWVVTLNSACRVIDKRCISKGGIASSLVDVKMLMRYVLGTLATSVIVAHNHPSGSVEPSVEDICITEKITTALSFFDIKLFDHIIIGNDSFYSLREKGKI